MGVESIYLYGKDFASFFFAFDSSRNIKEWIVNLIEQLERMMWLERKQNERLERTKIENVTLEKEDPSLINIG